MLKALSSLLGTKSPVFIWLVTRTQGRAIGTDNLGNRYYSGKARKGYKNERRWVMYKGAPEPSLVPPEWHAWLHHQSDTAPSSDSSSYRKSWQSGHRPNLTGTTNAYQPRNTKPDGAYEAWTPPQ